MAVIVSQGINHKDRPVHRAPPLWRGQEHQVFIFCVFASWWFNTACPTTTTSQVYEQERSDEAISPILSLLRSLRSLAMTIATP
jgi:hypothetical protein